MYSSTSRLYLVTEQDEKYTKYRRYSHNDTLHSPSHCRSNSANSVDVFNLIVPSNSDSTLSQLKCPACSLPMTRPTVLPCQHTFCFQCIKNNQEIRSSSLPTPSNSCLLSNINQKTIIQCQKCSRKHHIKSLSDLEENQSIQLLINTLLCEQCHQLYQSKQLDACSDCYGVFCINCYKEHTQNHRNDLITNKDMYRIVSTDETININMTLNSNDNEQTSDSQIFHARSFDKEKKLATESTKPTVVKENTEDESTDSSENNNSKKKSNNIFRTIMSPRHRRSTSLSNKVSIIKTSSSSNNKQIFSTKFFPRKKLNINTNIEDKSKTESIQAITPITPVSRFIDLSDQYTYTVQHIKQCKQRQIELDRTVKKLIEVLTIKTNENINQILQYWIHFKQILLDRFQSNTNRCLLFDYLFKTCFSNSDSQKQIDLYIEKNDEIKVALEVLSTTLTIVIDKQSLLVINQLFDREQQATIHTLKHQLESLLSSYSDTLSLINECINVYECRFTTWKDPHPTDLNSITDGWRQIIKEDYPSLIEKISNDFITIIPQLEKTLLQMLYEMRRRLLSFDNQTTSKRTNIS
ncbi:unnamed protein product [Rotaria sordida]|uniref:RING-type domain-containing protein n=1 Tax=Rotaria sordida TaxID=392033 RepID=A0A818QHS3_9BILA|nr:unnamed protein product [Rotaria sordida]